MRQALAPILMVVAVGALGCRQIAGIENIAPVDARSDTDAPAGGVCAPCPKCTQLAHLPKLPLSLVRVGTDLFVLNYGGDNGQGSLIRVPTAGDAPYETIEDNLTRPFSLVADATYLYWMGEDVNGGGIIEKRAISGGTTMTLARGLPVYGGLALSGNILHASNSFLALTATDLYFVDFTGSSLPNGVNSIPLDGGDASTFIPQYEPDSGIVADAGLMSVSPLQTFAIASNGQSLFVLDNNAYLCNGVFDGIFDVPLSGAGSPRVLVNTINFGTNLAVQDGIVAFCDTGGGTVAGELRTISTSGGGPSKLLDGTLGTAWAVAIDDGYVYCASQGSQSNPGSIVKVDVNGGHVVTLAAAVPAAQDLVVDSEYVFWVDSACGTTMKVPK